MPHGSAKRRRCNYCLPPKVKDGIYLNYPQYEDNFDDDSKCCSFKFQDDLCIKKTKLMRIAKQPKMSKETQPSKTEKLSNNKTVSEDRPGTVETNDNTKQNKTSSSKCSKICDNKNDYSLPKTKKDKASTCNQIDSEEKKTRKNMINSMRHTSGADCITCAKKQYDSTKLDCKDQSCLPKYSCTLPLCDKKSTVKSVECSTCPKEESQIQKERNICKAPCVKQYRVNEKAVPKCQSSKTNDCNAADCNDCNDLDNENFDEQTFLVINCRLGRPRNITKSPPLTTVAECSSEQSDERVCETPNKTVCNSNKAEPCKDTICPKEVCHKTTKSKPVDKAPICTTQCNGSGICTPRVIVDVHCQLEKSSENVPCSVVKRRPLSSLTAYCENAPHSYERICLPTFDGNTCSKMMANKVQECKDSVDRTHTAQHADQCRCPFCKTAQHNPYDVICKEHSDDCRCSLCIQNTFRGMPCKNVSHPKNCYCSACVERKLESNITRRTINSCYSCPVKKTPNDCRNEYPSTKGKQVKVYRTYECSRVRECTDDPAEVRRCGDPQLRRDIVLNCDYIDLEPSGFDDEDDDESYWNSTMNLVRKCSDSEGINVSRVKECETTNLRCKCCENPADVTMCKNDDNKKMDCSYSVPACKDEICDSSANKVEECKDYKILDSIESTCKSTTCKVKKKDQCYSGKCSTDSIKTCVPCTGANKSCQLQDDCENVCPFPSPRSFVDECPPDSCFSESQNTSVPTCFSGPPHLSVTARYVVPPCSNASMHSSHQPTCASSKVSPCSCVPSCSCSHAFECKEDKRTDSCYNTNCNKCKTACSGNADPTKGQQDGCSDQTIVKACDDGDNMQCPIENKSTDKRCCLHLRPQHKICDCDNSESSRVTACEECFKYRPSAGAKITDSRDQKNMNHIDDNPESISAFDQHPTEDKDDHFSRHKPNSAQDIKFATVNEESNNDLNSNFNSATFKKDGSEAMKGSHAYQGTQERSKENEVLTSSEEESMQRWIHGSMNKDYNSCMKLGQNKGETKRDLRPDKGKKNKNVIFTTPPCEYIDKSKKLSKKRCIGNQCCNDSVDTSCQTQKCRCECPCCSQNECQVKECPDECRKNWPITSQQVVIKIKDECEQTEDKSNSTDSSSVEEIFPRREVITCKPTKGKSYRTTHRTCLRGQKQHGNLFDSKRAAHTLSNNIYPPHPNCFECTCHKNPRLRAENSHKDSCKKSNRLRTCPSDSKIISYSSDSEEEAFEMKVPPCPEESTPCSCWRMKPISHYTKSENVQICSSKSDLFPSSSPKCGRSRNKGFHCSFRPQSFRENKTPTSILPNNTRCANIEPCEEVHMSFKCHETIPCSVCCCECPTSRTQKTVLHCHTEDDYNYGRESTIIVVIGGITSLDEAVVDRGGRSVWKCNIDRMTWIELAPLPQPRHNHGAAVINHFIYVTGGVHPNPVTGCPFPTDTTYVFLICDNKWQMGPNLTRPRSHHGSTAFYNKVWILGGKDDDGKFMDCVEYLDIATQQWVSVISLPSCRAGLSTATLRQKLYVVGGSSYINTGRKEANLYQPVECYSFYNSRWHCEPNLPHGCFCASLGAAKGYLFLLGGAQVYQNQNDDSELPVSLSSIYVLDECSQTWNCVNRLDPSRYNMGSAVFGSKIFLFGGITFDRNNCRCSVLDSGVCYDASYQRLSLPTFALPCPLTGCSCIVLREKCNH